MRNVTAALLLLVATVWLVGAGTSSSSYFMVVIHPEASVDIQSAETAVVKIRLRRGTEAIFAVQDACSGPPEDGTRVDRSGAYNFPLDKPGRYACLYTADGTLSAPIHSR